MADNCHFKCFNAVQNFARSIQQTGPRVTCAFLVRCERVEGALAVEQTHACRLKPGLDALSNRAVQQRKLAAA